MQGHSHQNEALSPAFCGLEELRKNWGWFLGLGLALIIIGTLCFAFATATTLFSVVILGILLFLSGITQTVYAFWARRWSGFFLYLIGGLLGIVVGFLLFTKPVVSALSLTLLVAAFCLAGGLVKIFGALTSHVAHKGWILFNGIISLLLGILIWAEWPESGLWVLGVFVAVDLLLTGWTCVALALSAKQCTKKSR